MTGYVARTEKHVAAPPERVWEVLTSTDPHPELMFGARTVTDWTVGGPVRWEGEWQGRSFTDSGEVLAVEPGRLLRMTHWSPLSGAPDTPENRHTLEYTLRAADDGTQVVLTQDNNATAEEAEHSASNWSTMLDGLRMLAERDAA